MHMSDQLSQVLLTLMKVETDSQNLQILLALLSCYCFSSLMHMSQSSEDPKTHNILEMINAVCELLNSRWLVDFAVSLAILDFFNLMVNLPYDICSSLIPLESVLVAVCHFIENQLARPPPAHSRDLHSTVVAAYGLLGMLLVRFPEVSKKKSTLTIVWEIIELGATGSKLQSSHLPRKPASQRVYSAADQLLRTMFCCVVRKIRPNYPIEDELYVVSLLKANGDGSKSTTSSTVQTLDFLYISFADSVIMAVAETEKLTNNSGQNVVIIRAPHFSPLHFVFDIEQAMPKTAPKLVQHPEGECCETQVMKTPSVFPPEVDKVPKCTADLSISEMVADQTVLHFAKELDAYMAKQKKPAAASQLTTSFPEVHNRCFGSRIHLARILLYDLGLIDPCDAEVNFCDYALQLS
ncbi:unnamed protein product [Soboliphyme baturini]|uniref:S phase cyclin A-associated protein in the endoplasmic reticulum n=1 Tax=Soboliphyme baturini TaxID=241478 RepID=A0A183J5M5_9BILA|nr:unnamed protein product [Soboliphyme baturini]